MDVELTSLEFASGPHSFAGLPAAGIADCPWLYCKNGHEMNSIVKATSADTITAKFGLEFERNGCGHFRRI